MPAPLARGIIITVSVLVAAGIAAYENPAVREWVERSREKIAIALHSLGDDIRPRSQGRNREDASMREEQGEKAEEKRRQMREEIMEKGRRMEERLKRRKTDETISEKRSPSFDTLVDDDGVLRPLVPAQQQLLATASGVEAQDTAGRLRSRHTENSAQPEQLQDLMHQSVDAPILLRQLDGPSAVATEPWESQYEREMRTTWNIPLPERSVTPSTHASESLLDLTPTTEDFPDPEMSIPSASDLEHPLDRTEYFSVPASHSSHTVSEAGGVEYQDPVPGQPSTEIQPQPVSAVNPNHTLPSSASSMSDSISHVEASEFGSEDDFSELGDGIRTPASAWTEVGSTFSGDD